MSWSAYPSYQDTNSSHFGAIPSHWQIAPLKRFFRIVGGSTPRSDVPAYWDGDVVWVTPGDLSGLSSFEIEDSARRITSDGLASCGSRLIPTDSIILSTRAPIGSVAIAGTELSTNQGCKSLVPGTDVDSQYFAYLLQSSVDRLNSLGKGTTFLELSGDALGGSTVLVPPLDEQNVIAGFLQRETARVDVLIAKQGRLIELLWEKRQALITRAVTKGLDPTVPMKDSGVQWLGEVPAHWMTVPLRRVIERMEQGWSPQCYNHPPDSDEWGVVKSGCVNRGRFDPLQSKALPENLRSRTDLEILEGDVLMSRASGSPSLVGSVARAGSFPQRLMLSDKIFRLQLRSLMDPDYFALAMGSNAVRTQIRLAISGADGLANNLPQSSILEIQVAVPPLSEQTKLVRYVNNKIMAIDAAIRATEASMSISKEHRSALISAAVTGKIDVREAA